jgi:hypothetical protein
MIIWRCLRFVIFSFDIFGRRRSPCTVALPFAIITPASFRSWATSPLYRRAAASFPIVSEIPFIAIPVSVSTSARAAGPVTARPIRRRGSSVSVVAPDRGRGILGPLQIMSGNDINRQRASETHLNAQAMSIKVPAVPAANQSKPYLL